MITTKKKIAEQILRRLSGGDVNDDSQYDIREIILLIEQAVSLLVKGNFLSGLSIGETFIGPQYISTFRNLPLLFDSELNLAYAEIPCNYLDLPDDRGVYQVSYMKDQENAFIPVRNGSETLFSHSPAKRLEGRTGYWIEQNRIYFKDNLYREGCSRILLKLVIASPHTVSDDAPYPIGSDMEMPIIEKVLSLLGTTIDTDDTNDNSNKK